MGVSMLEQLVEIFPGMLRSGEEQRGRMVLAFGEDAGGKDAGSLVGLLLWCGLAHVEESPPSGLAQTQHGHAGVIIVEHRLLGCLPLEFPENRLGGLGRRLDQLPLRGRRQWDAEAGLQLLDACKGQPAAVAQQGQHTADALVVFLGSGLRWRRRGEELPAEIAAQLLQLVKVRWKNRLSNDSQDGAGLGQTVELALGTIRTGIASSQF